MLTVTLTTHRINWELSLQPNRAKILMIGNWNHRTFTRAEIKRLEQKIPTYSNHMQSMTSFQDWASSPCESGMDELLSVFLVLMMKISQYS